MNHLVGVPRPPRDLAARLQLEEHVQLAVLGRHALDALDQLTGLEDLRRGDGSGGGKVGEKERR